MPQASPELRDKMKEYFGDPIDDAGPAKFLASQGFVNGPDWLWRHPEKLKWRDLTQKEKDCVIFLIEEWDEGGFTGTPYGET